MNRSRGMVAILLVVVLACQVFPGKTSKNAKAGGEDLLIAMSVKVELDRLGKGNVRELTLLESSSPAMTFRGMSQETVESNVRTYLVDERTNAADVRVQTTQASDTSYEVEASYSVEGFSSCSNGVWSIAGSTDTLEGLKQLTNSALPSPLALRIKNEYCYMLPSGSYVMYPPDDAHFRRVYGNSTFDITRTESPSGDGIRVDIRCDYFIARNDLVNLDWFDDFRNLLEVQYRCPEPTYPSLTPKEEGESVGGRSAQASTHTLQNAFLKAYINDEGNFRLEKSDGTALLYPRAWTSNFTLRVDDTNYSINLSPYLRNYIQTPLTVVDSTRAYIVYGFFGNKLQVKHEFILASQCLEFKVSCYNGDSVPHSVKVRYLLDTQLGPNDGAPLAYAGDVRTFETEVPNPSSVQQWRAYDTYPSPSIEAFGTRGYTSWYRLVFAYWRTAVNSIFDYVPNPNQRFFTPGMTGGTNCDSSVLLYVDAGSIAPSSSAAPLTFYYGTSSPLQNMYALKDEVLKLADNLRKGAVFDGPDSELGSYLKTFYIANEVAGIDGLVGERGGDFAVDAVMAGAESRFSAVNPATLSISLLTAIVGIVGDNNAYNAFLSAAHQLVTRLGPLADAIHNDNMGQAATEFANKVLQNANGEADAVKAFFEVNATLSSIDSKKASFESQFNQVADVYVALPDERKERIYNVITRINETLGREYDESLGSGERALILPTGETTLIVNKQDYIYKSITKMAALVGGFEVLGDVLLLFSVVVAVASIPVTAGASTPIALTVLSYALGAASLGNVAMLELPAKDKVVGLHTDALLFLQDEMGGKNEAVPAQSGKRYYTFSEVSDWTIFNIGNYQLDKVDGVVEDYHISESIDTSIFSPGVVTFKVRNTGSIPARVTATTYVNAQQKCSASSSKFIYPDADAIVGVGETKTVSKTFILQPNLANGEATPYFAYTCVYLNGELIYKSPFSEVSVGTPFQISQSQVSVSTLIDRQQISQGSFVSQNTVTGNTPGEVRFFGFYPGSQVDLHLYDSQGHHVGLNYQTGNIDIDIPGAKYSGLGTNPQWISVSNLTSTPYTVKVVGSDLIEPEPVTVVQEEIPLRPPILYSSPETIQVTQERGIAQDYQFGIMEVGGSQAVSSVSIAVTGSIAPWIGFNSASYANIPALTSVPIRMTMSVPFGSPAGTYTGEITVSSSNAGTVVIPVSATATDPMLPLLPSWNVIAVPFATPVSLLPTCDLFLSWDGSLWQMTTTLLPGTGYLVRNTAGATTVSLTGTPSSSPQTQPATGTWQIIGNPYTTPASVACTSSVPYLLSWDGSLWQLVSPTNLPPGLGFLLQSSSPGTITLTRLP